MSDILDVSPGAPLVQHEVVTEGELREREPGTVGEYPEPETGGHSLRCEADGDVQPLPQHPCDQTVLYLLHLVLRVEAVPCLDQRGSNNKERSSLVTRSAGCQFTNPGAKSHTGSRCRSPGDSRGPAGAWRCSSCPSCESCRSSEASCSCEESHCRTARPSRSRMTLSSVLATSLT